MTQIFANRPELMPIGETTQEHKRWQEEESALVERDRATAGLKGGLFRGCFRRTRRRQWAAIRDDGDGVNRCPECLWELEDGICPQCSIPGSSDSDGHESWDDDPYGMDGASIEDVLGVLDEDARMGRDPNPDFSEHGYSSEDGSSLGIAPAVERLMERRMTRNLDRVHAPPEEELGYDSFLDDTDENSQDDEANSLEGFIVNDVEDGQHSTTSSARSLHWETDEGTDEEANQPQDYDNGRNSQDEDGSNETASAVAQYDPEDESDEGPIVRSRRQVQRRSEASTQSSGSDGRGGSGVSQALNALRVRNGDNGNRVSANAQRNFPRRNPDTRRERSAPYRLSIHGEEDELFLTVPYRTTTVRWRSVVARLLSVETLQEPWLVGLIAGVKAPEWLIRLTMHLRPYGLSRAQQGRLMVTLLSLEPFPNTHDLITRLIQPIPGTLVGLQLAPTVERVILFETLLPGLPQPMLHHRMGFSSVEALGVAVHFLHVPIHVAQPLRSLIHQRQWKFSSREGVNVKRRRLREELNVGALRPRKK